jgi:hypothetical protein
MLVLLRACAIVGVLTVALPASGAGEKDTLSDLTQVSMKSGSDDVVVTIIGSKAPDFTSFTMTDPFRVVVDWAGSRLSGVTDEKRFERGLIRRITTKQYDSEAEKISRVTVELSRETSYHVEADGKRVMVHFVPVPDPIKEKDAEPAKKSEDKSKDNDDSTVAAAEGPLTEPATAVPQTLPTMPAKAEPAKIELAKTEPEPAIEKAIEKPAEKRAKPHKPTPMLADARDMKPLVVGKPEPRAVPQDVVAKSEPALVDPRRSAAKTEPKLAEAKPVEAHAKVEMPASPPKPIVLAANTNPSAPRGVEARIGATDDAQIASAQTRKNEPPPPKTIAKTERAKIAEGTPPPAQKSVEAQKPASKIAETPPPAKDAKPAVRVAESTPAKAAETKPAQKSASPPVEDKKLASLPTMSPDKKPVAAHDREQAPLLRTPPAATPDRSLSNGPQRFASNLPQRTNVAQSGWTVPSIAVKDAPPPRAASGRNLPVVRWNVAQNDGKLKPTATLPADPDEPANPKARSADVTDPGPSGDSGGKDFDPGPRVMKYIGFQQMAEVSRVFVRCDGKAKFKPSREGSTMVLELYNTRINVKNNERPLDTTYFNSAVTKVQAVKAGENTRVEVKLREVVPFKVTRIGTTIAIDFKRAG